MTAHAPRHLTAATLPALRALGALALVAVAADHLYEYAADHYSAIPTIGTLFLLNGAGALALAAALTLPLRRLLPGRPTHRVAKCAAVGGIALAMATLAGLLASEHTPLFGFQETGYRPVVVISIVAEAIAIVTLSLFLALARRLPAGTGRLDPVSPTRRSGSATMLRSSSSPPSKKGVPMKRLLIAAPIVVAVAVAVAVGVTSGAFSSGNAPVAVARSTMSMPMPMPASTSIASTPLRVELHRRAVKVRIANFAFVPARIEVSPGTRVEWTNEDQDPHTVTTDTPEFSSQALDTGQMYARVLTRTGTIAYHCTIHPFMHGTVVVKG